MNNVFTQWQEINGKNSPSPETNNQSPEGDTPSVATIGGGYWGKNLVRNFYNLNSLKLVSDKNEVLLSSLKEQYDGLNTCLALTDVLSRSDISGVAISTPAETHFNIDRESPLAGKHVYVEKPMKAAKYLLIELAEAMSNTIQHIEERGLKWEHLTMDSLNPGQLG